MLTHPTSERLTALGLTGMAKALDEQRRADTTFEPLGFEDRPGLLVDREAAERDAKRLTARRATSSSARTGTTAPGDTQAGGGEEIASDRSPARRPMEVSMTQ